MVLFRAVDATELRSIQDTGSFLRSPSGTEYKGFFFTAEGARQFAAQQLAMGGPTTHAEKFLKKRFEGQRVPHSKECFVASRAEIDEAFLDLERHMDGHPSLAQERQEIKALAKQKSNGLFLPASDSDTANLTRYRELRIARDKLDLEIEHYELRFKLQIGCNEGIEDLVAWITRAKMAVDQTLLKENYPEVWSACLKKTTMRWFKLLD